MDGSWMDHGWDVIIQSELAYSIGISRLIRSGIDGVSLPRRQVRPPLSFPPLSFPAPADRLNPTPPDDRTRPAVNQPPLTPRSPLSLLVCIHSHPRIDVLLASYWRHIGILLVSYGPHIGVILVSYWHPIGVLWVSLASYWRHIGVILASYWRHIGILWASYWRHIGILLASYGSHWRHIGVILASYWCHIGVLLASYWRPIGVILTRLIDVRLTRWRMNQPVDIDRGGIGLLKRTARIG